MKKTNDTYNITIGTLLILSSFIVADIIPIGNEAQEAVITVLIPTFLGVLGMHYIWKTIKYHWRCFQVKNYRKIKDRCDASK